MADGRKHTVDVLRKHPKQARSSETVRMIYEAAIQIIQKESPEKLTTNRIAEVAGFSVGTLYQYFRNKEALLLALAAAERDQMMQAMDVVFDAAPGRSLDETVRALVQVAMKFFFARHKVRRMIINTVLQQGMVHRMRALMTVAETHMGERLAELEAVGARPLSPAAQFAITRSFIGALRAGVLENSPLVGTRELEDELVRMIGGMLRA